MTDSHETLSPLDFALRRTALGYALCAGIDPTTADGAREAVALFEQSNGDVSMVADFCAAARTAGFTDGWLLADLPYLHPFADADPDMHTGTLVTLTMGEAYVLLGQQASGRMRRKVAAGHLGLVTGARHEHALAETLERLFDRFDAVPKAASMLMSDDWSQTHSARAHRRFHTLVQRGEKSPSRTS